MSNKMVLNVLSIKRWRVVDDKSGEVKEGCSVFISQDTEDQSGNTLGWDVIKFSAPLWVFEKAQQQKMVFPSECIVNVGLKMGAAGKGAMQVLDVEPSD